MSFREIEQGARGISGAECARYTAQGSTRSSGVVCGRMRQDHCMGLGVRKIEGPAKDVTELMMQ
jgi:hypothetical protein